jgi:hypothetical protein
MQMTGTRTLGRLGLLATKKPSLIRAPTSRSFTATGQLRPPVRDDRPALQMGLFAAVRLVPKLLFSVSARASRSIGCGAARSLSATSVFGPVLREVAHFAAALDDRPKVAHERSIFASLT